MELMGKTVGERKSWSPEGGKRGLESRHCGCKHFRVIYTRPVWRAACPATGVPALRALRKFFSKKDLRMVDTLPGVSAR